MEYSDSLDRAIQPRDCFLVTTQAQLGERREQHPNACGGVAGTDPQRFEDMALGLVKAAGKILAHADPCVGGGQISVNRQRPLAFGDALGGAVALISHHPQYGPRDCVVRPQFERLAQANLGGA